MTSKTGRMLSRLGTHRSITGAQSTQRIFSKATQNRNSTLKRTAELKLNGCHYEGSCKIYTEQFFIRTKAFILAINQIVLQLMLQYTSPKLFIITSAFRIQRDMLLDHILNFLSINLVETAKMHIHDCQFIMCEDFFEDLLKNIGKYHIGNNENSGVIMGRSIELVVTFSS
ncbi:hypothetical protein T10_10624 [Trichinella papuae]|uniref:Uncharacterized protein n=1 Tax=Trichinella papuae TaxID=268474 RepID=A0A0V1N7J5_9BILA|nr:hypothetical protein T10_10624 [Trichinella papuae]